MTSATPRFALPTAYVDPAFQRCLSESIEVGELVSNFDRLYKRTLATKHTEDDMREFAKFVHDCIYLRLPDEAIDALRFTDAPLSSGRGLAPFCVHGGSVLLSHP